MSKSASKHLIDLLSSPITLFIEDAYYLFLGRIPDPRGLEIHSSDLRLGLGRIQFLFNITKSKEYRARHQHLMTKTNDDLFIETYYQRYFNRPVEQEGLNYHLNEVRKGKSRTDIIKSIKNSDEARRTSTLWFELDKLLEDEAKKRHWFKRWMNQSLRLERRHNLELEVSIWQTYQIKTNLTGNLIYKNLAEDQDEYKHESIDFREAVKSIITPLSPILEIQIDRLGGNAKRIASRIQSSYKVDSNHK